MPLQFQDLPEDILLRIIVFLDPLDLLRLRQTSQQLFRFTSERTLWTSYYRNSSLFLPHLTQSTLFAYSARDIEMLLVQAQRMDKCWKETKFTFRRRDLPSTAILEGARVIEVYLGRYLFVGSMTRFALYDMDREDKNGGWDQPMFMSKPNKANGSAERWGYGIASSSTGNGDVYIPMFRTNKLESCLMLWRFQPRKDPPFVQIDQIPIASIATTPSVQASHQYLIYQSGAPGVTPNIYHFGTKRHYRLDEQHQLSTEIQSRVYHREYVATTDFLLVLHISARDTVFEVFDINPVTDSESGILKRTHIGILSTGLTEPALIGCRLAQTSVTPSDSASYTTLYLAAIFHHAGLQAFRAYLEGDGSIEFELPSSSSTPPNAIPQYTNANNPHADSSAFNLVLSVDDRGPRARARGVSLTANSGVSLLLHEIEWLKAESERTALGGGRRREDTEGLNVRSTSIVVPELIHGNDFAWDALSGRLVVRSGDGIVSIMDLV